MTRGTKYMTELYYLCRISDDSFSNEDAGYPHFAIFSLLQIRLSEIKICSFLM